MNRTEPSISRKLQPLACCPWKLAGLPLEALGTYCRPCTTTAVMGGRHVGQGLGGVDWLGWAAASGDVDEVEAGVGRAEVTLDGGAEGGGVGDVGDGEVEVDLAVEVVLLDIGQQEGEQTPARPVLVGKGV